MMKRTGVPRLGPDEPAPMPPQTPPQIQQPGASNMHTLAQTAQPQQILGATAMLSVGSGFGRAPVGYMKPQPVQYAPKPTAPAPPRHKLQPQPPAMGSMGRVSPAPAPQFQRLKVEDALSYLDQVKYKFNTQPQVYNDFLDIMKEFKSQTIDTPGVITRVSNLFKGHPELIVGFNTFLPPGYKIEVQSNGQVSVSMPSPGGLGGGVLLGVHQPQLVHLLPTPQSVTSAIVHNLSVTAPPPAPQNTLHHISQAHQQIEAAAIHHANPGEILGVQQSSGHNAPAPAGQPVEFNHAIEYVNKIKSRFSRQPDKYKRFLEILHAYQRGHRDVREPQAKQQTEQQVYSQVAKLFENQDDLLAEFGQFLPDAKAVSKPAYAPTPGIEPVVPPPQHSLPVPRPEPPPPAPSPPHAHHAPTSTVPKPAPAPLPPRKRSPSFSSATQIPSSAPPAKKQRVCGPRDVSYAEAAKYATLHEYNFFDKARKAMKSQDVYDNFLRCLLLYTNEIISGSELVLVTAPFLSRAPELQAWLTHLLTHNSKQNSNNAAPYPTSNSYTLGGGGGGLLNYTRDRVNIDNNKNRDEPQGRHERDIAQDIVRLSIDLSTCKRLGTSYCALPPSAATRKCSGRTALCKEVLNDTWVSFPTWSEDSTFVTSRKTQYEEYIYRCEDERFELDVVIETNAATIRVLEGIQKKLSRMSSEESAKYRLDDCLGGHSATIHQRALRRIYGDKVAVDIIAGLKKNPVVAVPVVLRRLKAKEEEWREAQKGFNKQWREQNEKYYLKSLDHQGINFKQNDLKSMRSKSLFNEVESAYAARRPPPHLVVDYELTSRQEAIKIVRDAAELLIHHARRQTTIQKAEKRRIKQLLRQFIPDLFHHPRQPLSDDERDLEDKDEPASPGSPSEVPQDNDKSNASVKQEKQESSESDNSCDKSSKHNKNDKENKPKNMNSTDSKDTTSLPLNSVKRSSSSNDGSVKSEIKMDSNDVEDDYRDHPPNESVFVCTMSWYLFLRAHGTLVTRLAAARKATLQLQSQHNADATRTHPRVADALRLRPNNLPSEVSSPAEYYNLLLELVKGVLDGNMEASAYEDAAREMLGIKAYPAYTIDKIVSIAVRQLQHCVSEPWSVRARELAAVPERGYVARAAAYLRQHHTAFLVKLYGGDSCRVSYELLESGSEGRGSPQHNDTRLSPTAQSTNEARAVDHAASWSVYTERYSRPDLQSHPHTNPHTVANTPVFLARNARRTGASQRNAASEQVMYQNRPHHAPRKRQLIIHDRSECCLGNSRARAVALRPHRLYRAGSLAHARRTHPRLHSKRRDHFHAWLHARTNHSNYHSILTNINTPNSTT